MPCKTPDVTLIPPDLAVLTTDEMYAADRAAIARGIDGHSLMTNAGWQVAAAIRRRYRPARVLVLAGPGNNGGDGFVVARLLAARGWPVRVASLAPVGVLSGDAARAASDWRGPVVPFEERQLANTGLVVDALFGAGLTRPVAGKAADMLAAVAARSIPVVAVDVPSGVDGNTGTISGLAIQAELTVTFFRRKPGHLLLPGRDLCGELVVADIGIPSRVLDGIAAKTGLNAPGLWRSLLPRPTADSHKFTRGHAVVLGGAEMTGAARLAAAAARRVGTGLVSIAAPAAALGTYRAGDAGLLVEPLADDFSDHLADRRRTAAILGPGAGRSGLLARQVLAALGGERPLVVDADALSVFAGGPGALFRAVRDATGSVVATPHAGEFERLFGPIGTDRLGAARRAAGESHMTVVLKGSDTVIASPDGRAAITADAPATLATAGSGDVLAGLIGGLLAQGMPAFEAAAAATCIHGRAADLYGNVLIAEDLVSMISPVLTEFTSPDARSPNGGG